MKIGKGYHFLRGFYVSAIRYKNIRYSLGSYKTIEEAKEVYLSAVEIVKNGIDIENKLKEISKTQKPQTGYYFDKSKDAYIVQIRIGQYKNESDAIKARDIALKKLIEN